jgi:hypothetical protein
MTYTVIQPAEQARLNALADELTPAKEYLARIETHCETARSDDWLALVRACNELEKTNG